MDARRHSLRQLATMAKARAREAWDHTAALLAAIHNAANAGRAPLPPTRFHPLRRAPRPQADVAAMGRALREQQEGRQ